jgi:hypothetical protein
MNLLGIRLTLLIGPTVAIPAPPPVADALQSVEVSESDQGRSGFQLTFSSGREGPAGLIDQPLLLNPLLRPFNRVIVMIVLDVVPIVLMDGIITHQQVSPGDNPGTSTVTVTGEDVSVMMDMEERSVEHPAQDETIIALKILASYAQYGLIPDIRPPFAIDPPIPIERTPIQNGTDRAYLVEMAARYSYVFYVRPGPVPFTNFAYWGPPERFGVPQPALSVAMGPHTNVESINFEYKALEPTMVFGSVQDRTTNIKLPVITFAGTRPPLSAFPALPFNLPNVKRVQPDQSEGLTYVQAYARAQARTDRSLESVATASGEVDGLRYGTALRPRGLVGLRGAGFSNDGFWYVNRVSHRIKRGEYKQSFSLSRDGSGSLTPVVMP